MNTWNCQGAFTLITWPRMGNTSESLANSIAPSPVQLTIKSKSLSWSKFVIFLFWMRPPAFLNRRYKYGRKCIGSTVNVTYRNPSLKQQEFYRKISQKIVIGFTSNSWNAPCWAPQVDCDSTVDNQTRCLSKTLYYPSHPDRSSPWSQTRDKYQLRLPFHSSTTPKRTCERYPSICWKNRMLWNSNNGTTTNTHVNVSAVVDPHKYGPHKPADPSPVVLGEVFSQKIVTSIPLPKCSANCTAEVAPQTPAPITAIFFTDISRSSHVSSMHKRQLIALS